MREIAAAAGQQQQIRPHAGEAPEHGRLEGGEGRQLRALQPHVRPEPCRKGRVAQRARTGIAAGTIVNPSQSARWAVHDGNGEKRRD
jgi:hypothetical protein